jgi:O-antigen/teichoic acid export membrane protein
MASFISNTLKLTIGTIIAQAAGILLIPILTRMYLPEAFGIFQIFLSIGSIVVINATLSYHFAIMLPERDEDSVTIVALSLVILTLVSLALLVVILLFAGDIGRLLNAPQVVDYLVWVPLFVFFNGLFVIATTRLSRKEKYGLMAAGTVVSSLSTKLVQVVIGILSQSPAGLIYGQFMGYGFADLAIFRGLKPDITTARKVTLARIREMAVRYKKFPLYQFPGNVFNTIAMELPTFMLAIFFVPEVVGHYSLANLVLKMPLALIGSAVWQVVFQRASEERNRTGGVKEIVGMTQPRLITLSVFPSVLLIAIAEPLFGFIFGPNWFVAGTYAKILILWIFMLFISSPISCIFAIIEQQHVSMYFDMITLMAWLGALYLGGILNNEIFALLLFSLTGCFIFGIKLAYLLRASGAGYRGSYHAFGKYLGISLIFIIPVVIVRFLSLSIYILFGIGGIMLLLYYLIIVYSDPVIFHEAEKILRMLNIPMPRFRRVQ